MLFGSTPRDPQTFVVVPLLLALVAIIACCVPARYVTKLDPLVPFRHNE